MDCESKNRRCGDSLSFAATIPIQGSDVKTFREVASRPCASVAKFEGNAHSGASLMPTQPFADSRIAAKAGIGLEPANDSSRLGADVQSRKQ